MVVAFGTAFGTFGLLRRSSPSVLMRSTEVFPSKAYALKCAHSRTHIDCQVHHDAVRQEQGAQDRAAQHLYVGIGRLCYQERTVPSSRPTHRRGTMMCFTENIVMHDMNTLQAYPCISYNHLVR